LKAYEKKLNKLELVTALRSFMGYHQSCGIESYPADDTVKKGLKALSRRPETGSRAGELSKPDRAAVSRQGGSFPAVQMPKKQLSVADLGIEIGRCRNCSLHRERQVSTAGSGGGGERPVKLMIVGDWLSVFRGSSATAGDLFGSAQDLMLSRMIEAITLSREEVFVTNVIKCSVPETRQPTSEHISSCSTYLHMQIEILSPRLICSMGIIASRLLTAQSRPLSQQRGRFFVYKTGSGLQIPVMPTYHPTFLLQNPEMKQATWADLQAIKQKLSG
jgi:DNA polymerase